MTDKEKLKEIKKLADAMYYAAFNLTTDASLLRKAMNEYHQFVIHKYCKEEPVSDECIYNRTLEERQKSCKFCSAACQVRIKEEPVSEGLEEASKKYSSCIYLEEVLSDDDKEVLKERLINTFKAGAKWQKLKDMGITNNVKGVVTNILNSSDEPLDNYAAEVAFIMLPANLTENYHMTNRDRISDAVRLGAKWQKEQMMAKAVDGDITFDYFVDYDKMYGCIVHDSFCLEDFGLKDGDKVKVIVIKED